ncbi:MAG: hypothetical protein H7Y09_14555 [Chitinophagaceae bacterium]|nr:hypothetical protein [Anaerolineae bacterium]
MVAIVLQGEINEEGHLKVQIPLGVTQVEFMMPQPDAENTLPDDDEMQGNLGSLLELFGLWADRGIEDSTEYSRQLQRRMFGRHLE